MYKYIFISFRSSVFKFEIKMHGVSNQSKVIWISEHTYVLLFNLKSKRGRIKLTFSIINWGVTEPNLIINGI